MRLRDKIATWRDAKKIGPLQPNVRALIDGPPFSIHQAHLLRTIQDLRHQGKHDIAEVYQDMVNTSRAHSGPAAYEEHITQCMYAREKYLAEFYADVMAEMSPHWQAIREGEVREALPELSPHSLAFTDKWEAQSLRNYLAMHRGDERFCRSEPGGRQPHTSPTPDPAVEKVIAEWEKAWQHAASQERRYEIER